MADSLINPTIYTFDFSTATDAGISVNTYGFDWSTTTAPTGVSNFDLQPCTPSPNFDLQSCDSVQPIFPAIQAYSGQTLATVLSVTTSFISLLGYSGSNLANLTLTINPVDILAPRDNYSGQACEVDLFTLTFFSFDFYSGGYADADLFTIPAPELPADAYHGSAVDVDLWIQQNISADAYHGSYGDSDLSSYPSALLDADAYHGSTAIADTLDVPWGLYAYHGSYADADLTDVPSEGLGVANAYHGSYADADVAPAYNLSFTEAYAGEYAYGTQLSFATTFDVEGFHGSYANADFTEVLGEPLPVDGYHGSTAIADTLAVTVALFPRGYSGQTLSAVLEIHPASELTINVYHGSRGVVDALDETNWNMYAYSGADSVVDLALQLSLSADAYHGSTALIPYINYTANLPCDAYHGSRGYVASGGLFVPVGEGLTALAYAGERCDVTADIRIHAILTPLPIVAGLAMYDADHNHNHCPTVHVDPNYGDTHIRFDWNDFVLGTDHLDFGFDDTFITRNWYPCASHVTQCEFELRAQPRFQFNVYEGSNTLIYMPKKFESFGAVPLDVLYDENTNFINVRRMYLEVDFYEGANSNVYNVGADDYLATVGVTCSAELTPTVFGDFRTGSHVEANLSVSIPSWRSGAFRDAPHATLNFFTFEPIFWTKFCHGYIRPIGEAVIFEFSSEDNTGCEGKYYIEDGSSLVCNLSVEQAFWPDEIKTGNYVSPIQFTYQSIWLLIARGGEHLAMASNVTFEARAYDGMFAQGKFYVQPWYGHGGEYCSIDVLSVAGAAVAWVTAEDCLPNEYIPITPDGDLDYGALDPDNDGIRDLPEVAVEQHEFYFPLFAHCVTYEAP